MCKLFIVGCMNEPETWPEAILTATFPKRISFEMLHLAGMLTLRVSLPQRKTVAHSIQYMELLIFSQPMPPDVYLKWSRRYLACMYLSNLTVPETLNHNILWYYHNLSSHHHHTISRDTASSLPSSRPNLSSSHNFWPNLHASGVSLWAPL